MRRLPIGLLWCVVVETVFGYSSSELSAFQTTTRNRYTREEHIPTLILNGDSTSIKAPPLLVNGTFVGEYLSGEGDVEYLQLMDKARRMFGPDAEYQSIPMLYTPAWNGMLEGPTWKAWWTQNSYGTVMAGLPLMDEPLLKWIGQSIEWFYDHMGNGITTQSEQSVKVIPDGTMCDNASPSNCNYRQGDGSPALHDVTIEETLSAVVMQAEYLLTTRNLTAIRKYLPMMERTANLLESRRDATGQTYERLFLSGPASNLLAPSFAAWKQPNGKYLHSYSTALTVSYSAALHKMIELEKMVNRTYHPVGGTIDYKTYVAMWEQRLAWNDESMKYLWADRDKNYLLRSIDPNGTVHGVLGKPRYGYFEASPNHDAVCFNVVDAEAAERIYKTFDGLDAHLRPFGLVLPNWPGYDDMYVAWGRNVTSGLWGYGEWVNGGHWTTCEARYLMGAFRTGRTEPARQSMRAILKFANEWRMDNPLTKRGSAVYQPKEPINLTIDAFGSPAALLRGILGFVYTATTLFLQPHLPTTITRLTLNYPVRWADRKFYISTVGIPSNPITNVTLSGSPWHHFNSTFISFPWDSIAVMSSKRLNIIITFGTTTGITPLPRQPLRSIPTDVPPFKCDKFPSLVVSEATSANAKNSTAFIAGMAKADLSESYEAQQAELFLSYAGRVVDRCDMLTNGTVKPLVMKSQTAADELFTNTHVNVYAGLSAVLAGYRTSTDAEKRRIWSIWAGM